MFHVEHETTSSPRLVPLFHVEHSPLTFAAARDEDYRAHIKY